MSQSEPQNDCLVCLYWQDRINTIADLFGDEKRARLELAEHRERSHAGPQMPYSASITAKGLMGRFSTIDA